MTRKKRIKWGQWVVTTCLTFGCSPHTAFLVAGELLKRLDEDDKAKAQGNNDVDRR